MNRIFNSQFLVILTFLFSFHSWVDKFFGFKPIFASINRRLVLSDWRGVSGLRISRRFSLDWSCLLPDSWIIFFFGVRNRDFHGEVCKDSDGESGIESDFGLAGRRLTTDSETMRVSWRLSRTLWLPRDTDCGDDVLLVEDRLCSIVRRSMEPTGLILRAFNIMFLHFLAKSVGKTKFSNWLRQFPYNSFG